METKDKTATNLDKIPYNTQPKLLFVGNGINRCFDGNSWEELIKRHTEDVSLSYNEIKTIPLPLQIVLATNDKVDKSMKKIAEDMVKQEYLTEEIEMYKALLDLPFSDIVTTNYTYELEVALSGGEGGITRNKWLKFTHAITKNNNDDKTNWLHRCSEIKNRHIWHIHGEIGKPNHMVIGHYYYNKVSACIQSYIPELIRRYKYCKKNGADFKLILNIHRNLYIY